MGCFLREGYISEIFGACGLRYVAKAANAVVFPRLLAVLLISFLFGANAFAQTPTPTPTPVPDLLRISAIDDISFGPYTGNGGLTAEDPICIFNSASSSYRITFTTSTGGFDLASGANTLPFTLRYKAGGGSYQAMSYNSATQFGSADTSSQLCGGSTNASYEVSMTQAQLLSVRPGAYSATMTIVIEQP
jgi:hypothetical protein